MTKILVTGGSGKLGRAVLRDLVEHGFDVLNLDQQALPEPICPSVRVDLSNFGEVAAAILGGIDEKRGPFDAVVHLAAIPAPGLAANARTISNNVAASYNIFEACRLAGIKNVVFASSETVLGLPFDTPPPYVPVDEEYFPRPESAYSLGKLLDETMAAQFCRWDPDLRIVGLRFSNVMYPEDYATFPGFDSDPNKRKWNLWGYIDARDGAQAVRRAILADFKGFEAFIIANADTVMSRSNISLLAEVFPEVEQRGNIATNSTLLSIDKAKRMLGFSPQYSWRNAVA
ncbi:NAD(P)-dependent oxidoreductase [Devosia sp. 63-57]|uniref:NAD-dependent epimerase/dehydratase family protein n=1 Tax=Devosia sp. 63-57 TaxID=1895751 RepID=UPI00086B54B9|nr:NAD(P)-dependent oxidoreductase [Devosia sp. 63-57]ODT47432.1 MAG: UDP-glucose 4-epimerase [Pelagibacterium sp. SCN 63-126]ODU87108.1 MAG: UDP-glucose 4-epimerase [Pelagibacterium sp. SCN 63-17]OJX42860.1 MAG: UDP-glucose 4-epimerase [Devosia sp. 63-57]